VAGFPPSSRKGSAAFFYNSPPDAPTGTLVIRAVLTFHFLFRPIPRLLCLTPHADGHPPFSTFLFPPISKLTISIWHNERTFFFVCITVLLFAFSPHIGDPPRFFPLHLSPIGMSEVSGALPCRRFPFQGSFRLLQIPTRRPVLRTRFQVELLWTMASLFSCIFLTSGRKLVPLGRFGLPLPAIASFRPTPVASPLPSQVLVTYPQDSLSPGSLSSPLPPQPETRFKKPGFMIRSPS